MPTQLTPEVRAILEASTITANSLTLPPGRLDPKTYKAVNVHIENAGGKWSKKEQKHLFTTDARTALGMVLAEGKSTDHVKEHKKMRQAFYTPDSIAAEVAELADVHGMHVLEPSAGEGALADACVRQGAAIVECYEIDEKASQALNKKNHNFITADFLEQNPKIHYDRVVMNPPFTRKQHIKHVRHAQVFLKVGGELYAIVPDNNDLPECETLKRFPAGSFRESGTQIATRLIMYRRNG